MFKNGIPENGCQDNGKANVESGGKVVVLMEQQACQYNAIQPFEVYGEVDGVGREVLHEVDAGNERIYRTHAGENDEQDDVAVGEGEELRGIAAFNAQEDAEPDECGAELNEGKHGGRNRLALVLDENTVVHAEDGSSKCRQDAEKDAEPVLKFYRKNKADGTNDDEADDELIDNDFALVYQRLHNGGEQRAGAESSHGYGNVGNLDGTVKAKPVNTDDKANHGELQEALQRYFQAGFDIHQVKAHEKHGKPDPVPYQR